MAGFANETSQLYSEAGFGTGPHPVPLDRPQMAGRRIFAWLRRFGARK